jgi:N-acetyltransferase
MVKPQSMDLQPTLRSNLLLCRPLLASDYDALFEVARDPLVWEQHPARDRHKETVFASFFREALECAGTLAVVDRNLDVMIGSSRFHGYDPSASEVEIGWTFLARSHWGGRYNGELKRLMLAHAFQSVDSVVLLVGPDNVRSQHAVEKIGGVRDGTRNDGSGMESLVYRVTPSFKGLS